MPYKYIKDESFDQFNKQVNWKFYTRTRLLSFFLFFAGVSIFFTQIVFPVYIFKTSDEVAKPIADTIAGVASGYREFKFSELDQHVPPKGSSKSAEEQNLPQFFYITIPKLRIKDAKVEPNAPTLNPDKALGHYAGTALPGETGNSFIYGHSVLPIFYNPKNYKSIFSTLGDLETGDEIIVTFNNVPYVYKVENKSVISPEKIDPKAELKPAYLNESTLTLMTCWPAGLKTKRLLVNSVMVN